MKNTISNGNTIEWTNGTGSTVTSGSVVAIGKFCGVAVADIKNGETGAVCVEGIFELPKKTKSDVVAVGDQLIYNSGIKVISAGTTLPIIKVGYAVKASAATDDNVIVKLG